MIPANGGSTPKRYNSLAKRQLSPDVPDIALARIIERLCEYFCDVHAHWDDDEEPLALALWTIHTWFIRMYEFRYNFTVYLYVVSHNPDSGKTELALALALVCPGDKKIRSPTVAQIKRFLMNDDSRVLIIDQYHNLGNARSTDREKLTEVLANGHRPGVLINDTSLDNTPIYYDPFYPKAFFGLDKYQPDTETTTRCIRVNLHPANISEARELGKRQNVRPPVDNASGIHAMISEWLTDITTRQLDQRMTAMGKVVKLNDGEIFNREADNWRMLFALADMAGKTYGKRIRDYASKMTSSHAEVSREDISDAARIDELIVNLARTGKLPIDNWYDSRKPPVSDHPDIVIRPNELGWPRSRSTNDKRLPTITLVCNPAKREAEIRIRTIDADRIAGAMGYTRDEFIRTYRNAKRLHSQKSRNDISLALYSGQKESKVYAIDFSPVVFGIDYGTTDVRVRETEKILAAETIDEINRVMES